MVGDDYRHGDRQFRPGMFVAHCCKDGMRKKKVSVNIIRINMSINIFDKEEYQKTRTLANYLIHPPALDAPFLDYSWY